MQTRAIISRHAVHPLLIVLPVGLVVTALYAVNIWLRLGYPTVALAIALSVSGAGMLAVLSWLDGARVRIRATR